MAGHLTHPGATPRPGRDPGPLTHGLHPDSREVPGQARDANGLTTRFAPSPTGSLHLGHAFAALTAQRIARDSGGRFLLRIEDIDRARCRSVWEQAILDDLDWLGIPPDAPPIRQSDRMNIYLETLDTMWNSGLLYPCFCNRRDILSALDAPQEGVPSGPDGPVYPGTCRHRPRPKQRPVDAALRLDMRAALTGLGPLTFTETAHPDHHGQNIITAVQLIDETGDIVLARRDMGTSYHLSVVIDDAAQGITMVTRGADLFDATRIHVLLQTLLGLSTPHYHHHRLIRDDLGKRLAKRDDARALATYRAAGATPQTIRDLVNL